MAALGHSVGAPKHQGLSTPSSGPDVTPTGIRWKGLPGAGSSRFQSRFQRSPAASRRTQHRLCALPPGPPRSSRDKERALHPELRAPVLATSGSETSFLGASLPPPRPLYQEGQRMFSSCAAPARGGPMAVCPGLRQLQHGRTQSPRHSPGPGSAVGPGDGHARALCIVPSCSPRRPLPGSSPGRNACCTETSPSFPRRARFAITLGYPQGWANSWAHSAQLSAPDESARPGLPPTPRPHLPPSTRQLCTS